MDDNRQPIGCHPIRPAQVSVTSWAELPVTGQSGRVRQADSARSRTRALVCAVMSGPDADGRQADRFVRGGGSGWLAGALAAAMAKVSPTRLYERL
jgi:hypothetical protein